MPDSLHRSLAETLAEARACFEDLRLLGIQEVPGLELAGLSPCPDGVTGIDRGGTNRCRQETLAEIFADLGECRRCPLGKQRKRLVLGQGVDRAAVFFVGGVPDRAEEEAGFPFAGESGALFERMLQAIGLERSSVYLSPAVMCRAPQQHELRAETLAACTPFLHRQIRTVRPVVLVACGESALQALGMDDSPFAAVRGKWLDWHGTPLIATFHPSRLLTSPPAKRESWEDLKQILRRLRSAGMSGQR